MVQPSTEEAMAAYSTLHRALLTSSASKWRDLDISMQQVRALFFLRDEQEASVGRLAELFGFVHDFLPGPSFLRGIIFATGAALIVFIGIAPYTGAGLFCLKLGLYAPAVVALFHLAHGAILGAIYGKLIDTDEARDYLAGHPHR